MSGAFGDELDNLAEKIRAHPLLELIEHARLPPASSERIARVETEAGLELPESVKRFYEAVGGASLKWRVRSDLPTTRRDKIRQDFSALTPSPDRVFTVAGSIHLLPLEDMLLSAEYALPQSEDVEGEFDFEGRTYADDEFSAMLRPFDIIDDFFCMAFVVQREVPEWKLMYLSDYWIEYDHSRVTWLDDYLAFVIATWGLVDARFRAFSEYRGDRQPPLRFEPEAIAALVPSVLSEAPRA